MYSGVEIEAEGSFKMLLLCSGVFHRLTLVVTSNLV